jgi:hypothetical protein
MKYQASVKFVEELVREVPKLRPIYDEHVVDHEESLPHVFFGDVTRFAISEAARDGDHEALGRLLEKLESGLREGPAEVKGLVIASFIENLCGETAAIRILSPLMGESLRAQLKSTCGE